MEEIDKLLELSDLVLENATTLCLIEVEKKARGILLKNKKLNEFVMAMGTYTFTRKDRNYLHDFEDSDFNSFMDKYSDLGLTGTPMRFTAKGDVITDW